MKPIITSKRNIQFATITTIAALLIVFISSIAIFYSSPESTKPIPRKQSYAWMSLSEWFVLHAQDIELAEVGESKIIFLGDSITQNWSETEVWQKYFQPLNALNFGIGGDTTQNLLWRLENGATGNLNPERVVLLIGTNNLSFVEETPKEIALGAIAIVKNIKTAFPEAKILLMAVLPREEQPNHPYRIAIEQLNQHLKTAEKLENVTYLDIGRQFLLPNGKISPILMPDFLHPAEKGYQIWTKEILQWINSSK